MRKRNHLCVPPLKTTCRSHHQNDQWGERGEGRLLGSHQKYAFPSTRRLRKKPCSTLDFSTKLKIKRKWEREAAVQPALVPVASGSPGGTRGVLLPKQGRGPPSSHPIPCPLLIPCPLPKLDVKLSSKPSQYRVTFHLCSGDSVIELTPSKALPSVSSQRLGAWE